VSPTQLADDCPGIRHPDRDFNAGSSKIRASLPHETETEEERKIARVRDFDLSSRVERVLRTSGSGREDRYQCHLHQHRPLHRFALIVGLPKFADVNRFAVTAKVAVFSPGNAPNVDEDTLRLMLQGVLADRFRLKAHTEDRPVEAYVLTASKQTKLKRPDPQNRTHCKSGDGTNPILNRGIACQNMSMSQFAAALPALAPNYVLTPVRNATGLDGFWDFSFNFSAVNSITWTQVRSQWSIGIFGSNRRSQIAERPAEGSRADAGSGEAGRTE
jgi:uncharacterized protein (TIGR03435 family)